MPDDDPDLHDGIDALARRVETAIADGRAVLDSMDFHPRSVEARRAEAYLLPEVKRP